MEILLAGIPLAALGWLGWRLLVQEQGLEQQRQHARLEEAAATIAHDLDRALARWEERLPALEPVWRRFGLEEFVVRIGLNSGEAIVGSMGPPSAPIVSAIGDTVNSAARLESLTKQYGCTMIVSVDALRYEPGFSVDLIGELAGGTEHEHLRPVDVQVDPGEQREPERRERAPHRRPRIHGDVALRQPRLDLLGRIGEHELGAFVPEALDYALANALRRANNKRNPSLQSPAAHASLFEWFGDNTIDRVRAFRCEGLIKVRFE